MRDLDHLQDIIDRIEHNEPLEHIRKDLREKSEDNLRNVEQQWHNQPLWKLALTALVAFSIAAVFLIQRNLTTQEQLDAFDFGARVFILIFSGLAPVMLLSQEPFHRGLPDDTPFPIRLKLTGKLVGIAYLFTLALSTAHLGVNDQLQKIQVNDTKTKLEAFFERLEEAKALLEKIAPFEANIKKHVDATEKTTRAVILSEFQEVETLHGNLESQLEKDSASIVGLRAKMGVFGAVVGTFAAGLADTSTRVTNALDEHNPQSLAARVTNALDEHNPQSLATRIRAIEEDKPARLTSRINDLETTASDSRNLVSRINDALDEQKSESLAARIKALDGPVSSLSSKVRTLENSVAKLCHAAIASRADGAESVDVCGN